MLTLTFIFKILLHLIPMFIGMIRDIDEDHKIGIAILCILSIVIFPALLWVIGLCIALLSPSLDRKQEVDE